MNFNSGHFHNDRSSSNSRIPFNGGRHDGYGHRGVPDNHFHEDYSRFGRGSDYYEEEGRPRLAYGHRYENAYDNHTAKHRGSLHSQRGGEGHIPRGRDFYEMERRMHSANYQYNGRYQRGITASTRHRQTDPEGNYSHHRHIKANCEVYPQSYRFHPRRYGHIEPASHINRYVSTYRSPRIQEPNTASVKQSNTNSNIYYDYTAQAVYSGINKMPHVDYKKEALLQELYKTRREIKATKEELDKLKGRFGKSNPVIALDIFQKPPKSTIDKIRLFIIKERTSFHKLTTEYTNEYFRLYNIWTNNTNCGGGKELLGLAVDVEESPNLNVYQCLPFCKTYPMIFDSYKIRNMILDANCYCPSMQKSILSSSIIQRKCSSGILEKNISTDIDYGNYALTTGNRPFNEEEVKIFVDIYTSHPKRFDMILEFLPHRKYQEVIQFYYENKHRLFLTKWAKGQATNRKRKSSDGDFVSHDLIKDIKKSYMHRPGRTIKKNEKSVPANASPKSYHWKRPLIELEDGNIIEVYWSPMEKVVITEGFIKYGKDFSKSCEELKLYRESLISSGGKGVKGNIVANKIFKENHPQDSFVSPNSLHGIKILKLNSTEEIEAFYGIYGEKYRLDEIAGGSI